MDYSNLKNKLYFEIMDHIDQQNLILEYLKISARVINQSIYPSLDKGGYIKPIFLNKIMQLAEHTDRCDDVPKPVFCQ